ncbi:MAG: endolytic transglycosylase MltG [Lachnospiraceae bacterium]|nr:endolytic transglycosylase MltG [Lachnospiraceae bacterium]
MKLKYYMRGLGIGIAVTALLMGIAFSGHKKETMTDEEIRQRALEMGMVDESGVLADNLKTDKEEDSEEPAEAPEEIPKPQVSDNKVEKETETEQAQAGEAAKPGKTEAAAKPGETEGVTEPEGEPLEPEPVEEMVVVTVNSGDGSRTVSNKLKQAGLIEDADYYDSFLCQNGYDKRLASGAHEIPVGASDEEIAKILMQRPGGR